MTSHAIQPIPVVAAYQARAGLDQRIPVVVQDFAPDRGWKRHPWRKRISRAYARTLRRQGIQVVGLEVAPGRVADFQVAELVR